MNADGFRCDVADQIPLDFWREGVRRVREINPDTIMLNEGSNLQYLEVFDADYYFPTLRALTDLFIDHADNGAYAAEKKPREHDSAEIQGSF